MGFCDVREPFEAGLLDGVYSADRDGKGRMFHRV